MPPGTAPPCQEDLLPTPSEFASLWTHGQTRGPILTRTFPLCFPAHPHCLSRTRARPAPVPRPKPTDAAVDRKGRCPFCLCTHRFPQLPTSPTSGSSFTSPRAGRAMDALAGCPHAGRSEVQPCGAARTLHKWAVIFGNLPLPGSRHQWGCCADSPKPRASGTPLPAGCGAQQHSGS